jgi:hypothetical protein
MLALLRQSRFREAPIDIYSRVDGALAALLAFRLKSCDSVDCRLTAGREQRPPASETRGSRVWPQLEVYSAAGLQQAGAPKRTPA